MYTKYTKQVLNGQGLTRKDDCFHGLLKDWTAAITTYFLLKKHKIRYYYKKMLGRPGGKGPPCPPPPDAYGVG